MGLRILQLSPRVPFPLHDGGAIGIFHITQGLAERGHHVRLVCLAQQPVGDLSELQRFCELEVLEGCVKPNSIARLLVNLGSRIPLTVDRYRSSSAMWRIREMIGNAEFDLVHVDHIHMAWYGLQIAEKLRIPVVLRAHNLDMMVMRRFSERQRNPLARIYTHLQCQKLKRYEIEVSRRCARCLMITDEEQQMLKRLAPDARTTVVPAGVDTAYWKPMDLAEDPSRLVSVASMDWHPNVDSILWFCRKVLPRIVSVHPRVQFHIIGKNPPRSIRRLESDHVIVRGFVEDPRPEIAQASVFVVPVRQGAGLRIKVLNAFAMGKAVVTTSLGCDGLSAISGRHALVADMPEAFASSVCSLMADPIKRRELSQEALALVRTRFTWNRVAEQIEHEYFAVIEENRPSVPNTWSSMAT